MFGVICTLLAVVLLAYFVIKNYYPPIILLVLGLVLLLIGYFMGNPPVSAKTATNFIGFDLAQAVTDLTKSRIGGLGLNIMAIGGFATYMNKIGASKALVKLCVRPLSAIHSPYVLLGLTYVVGQCMALFINSAVGLGLLLMASVYPLLVQLGVRRAAAAAVIGSTCCLDLGPSSSNAMRAADLLHTAVVSYFVTGQIPVAICIIIAVAVGHALVQRWFDRREAAKGIVDDTSAVTGSAEDAFAGAGPAHYAILPILPLFLLIIFSPMVYNGIKLGLVTAIIVSILVAFVVDLLTRRDFRQVCKESQSFFEGMGKVFTSTVALIICAEFFATGLKSSGLIDVIINSANGVGAGMGIMTVLLTAIVSIVTFLTGSGVGAYSSFASLAPDVAAGFGGSVEALVTPMQFASGMIRAMSPVAGVIIAVAGAAGVSPMAIVRRTWIPMVLGMITTLIFNQIFFG